VYPLTAIERSTRWVEAVPPHNMEASTCTDAFIANWVERFGMPATVTTQTGAPNSPLLYGPMPAWASSTHITTANHPQSNGMVEQIYRQISDALRAPIPWAFLCLRAALKEKSAVSLAELVTGSPLIPGQPLHVPDPTRVDVPPSPYAASDSHPAYLARAEHVYVYVGGQQMPLAASRCRWWPADSIGGQQMPLAANRCRWWPADAVGGQQVLLAASRCR
jgi:hypothetical protein